MAESIETEADALAYLAAELGPVEARHQRFARRVGGSNVWSFGTLDENGRPRAGSNQKLGPDGRIWRFSSNAGIHDSDLVDSALAAIYEEGIADVVEADSLADLVRSLTEQRRAHVRQIVQAAQAGELRKPPDRRLP